MAEDGRAWHTIIAEFCFKKMRITGIHLPLPKETERIGRLIVNAAYEVHKELGPGLLEKIYETCFCYELKKLGLDYQRQIDVPISYQEITFEEGLRFDVLVENQVICELKSVETVHPVYEAQILSQLRLTGIRLGFLINFHTPLIKDGIRRFVM
jgi:GxxExxY protein